MRLFHTNRIDQRPCTRISSCEMSTLCTTAYPMLLFFVHSPTRTGSAWWLSSCRQRGLRPFQLESCDVRRNHHRPFWRGLLLRVRQLDWRLHPQRGTNGYSGRSLDAGYDRGSKWYTVFWQNGFLDGQAFIVPEPTVFIIRAWTLVHRMWHFLFFLLGCMLR